MEYITLNNGLEMPILGYGTYKVTDSISGADIVSCALETGYRLLDTAQAYGNEEAVGEGILQSGVDRRDIFITTKVWFTDFETGECEKSVYQSLKKLKTDYLDMVLLHWPYGNYYAAWRDLEKLYEKGIIKAIGVSNFDPARLMDLINFNKITPAVNQIEAHLYCQRNLHRFWMDKYNVACQAYAPLGKGKVNEIFTLPQITALCEKYNRTPAQIMLRFLTSIGIVVIPKSARPERIKENFDIFGFELTSDEIETLKGLNRDFAVEGIPEVPEKVEAMVDRILFQG